MALRQVFQLGGATAGPRDDFKGDSPGLSIAFTGQSACNIRAHLVILLEGRLKIIITQVPLTGCRNERLRPLAAIYLFGV